MKVKLLFCLLLTASSGYAQMSMPAMAAMENSVGTSSSGTSVEPKVSSESSAMIHKSLGNWVFMFHANAFLVDTQQRGPRGKNKLYSINWLMPMISREFGRQTITFRTMFSVEPATITDRRYPLILQGGETAYGIPIVDGQHPHEAIMELAARYDVKIGERTEFFVYGGPVGEPALGPPAFPHRASSSENPVAVLGHHQQDSTHVSDSVITMGFAGGPLQLEASTFHGREPNEDRWNIDKGRPDSYSWRLSTGLGSNWSGQFSMGVINSREALEPNVDTIRTTASLHNSFRFSSGHMSTSFIWGRNKDLHEGTRRIFNAYTAESTLNFLRKNWLWSRIENLDRDRTFLVPENELLDTEEDPIGRVQALTVGYERDFPIGISSLNLGLGVQATTYRLPEEFRAVYGSRPAGVSVFLHLRPSGNFGSHMQLMHQH